MKDSYNNDNFDKAPNHLLWLTGMVLAIGAVFISLLIIAINAK